MLDFDTLNIDLGVGRVSMALHRLNDPHLSFPAIHVAGTNGKGSVCAMLSSIFKEAGYRVGLFTSPHLFKWNERIKINGENISDSDFLRIKNEISGLGTYPGRPLQTRSIQLTPFEIVTCIAFRYFAQNHIDIAVVEVGMGGRLDATNVVNPIVSVITNVDFDHTEYLGDSLEKIAFEKAGIIKEKGIVVTAAKNKEVLNMIRNFTNIKQARLVLATDLIDEISNYPTSLKGGFQKENLSVVLQVVKEIKKQGYNINDESIKNGLENTKWPGRFQMVSGDPLVIVDGAHNEAGANALKEAILSLNLNKNLTFIFGFQDYKDIKSVLAVLAPLAHTLILTKSSHPQAARTEKLSSFFVDKRKNFHTTESVPDAILKAKAIGDAIIVTGSLFIVAEALCFLGFDKV